MSRLDLLSTYHGSKCDLFEVEKESCKGCRWYPNPLPNISMCRVPAIFYNRPEIGRISEELCHVLRNS